MKRYVKEFAADIIKHVPVYESPVKSIIRFYEKNMITDFEAMQALCKILKEEE